MTKVVYRVEENYQVLRSGSWDDECPDWYWETKYHEFPTQADADRYLDGLVITNDMPMARYFQRTYTWDGECWDYEDGDYLRSRD